MKKPRILITLGDFNGIGPEVTLKALQDNALTEQFVPVIVGAKRILTFYRNQLNLSVDMGKWEIVDCLEGESVPIKPGRISPEAGRASGKFLEKAVEWAKAGKGDAIVTAPIAKEALWMAGYSQFPGQTEFFAARFGVKRFAMVLIARRFRVAFVTTHHPIRQVADRITPRKIEDTILAVTGDLKKYFGIAPPRVAVSALNPHGGEHGRLGDEEETIIRPTLEVLRKKGVAVWGPFPADTLFANVDAKEFDAYVAMYHDQGMVAIKMYGFGSAVNFTAGLPVPRTSPDHGTAFDIAGRGIARAESMKEALRLAVQLAAQKS